MPSKSQTTAMGEGRSCAGTGTLILSVALANAAPDPSAAATHCTPLVFVAFAPLPEESGDGAARAVEESLAGGEIFAERRVREHG